MNDIIIYFSLKYNGESDRIFGALTNKEEVDQNLKNELFEQQKSKYISILTDEYPEALKHIDYPPFTLSVVGDISLLLNERSLAQFRASMPDSRKEIRRNLFSITFNYKHLIGYAYIEGANL